jgi:DNA-binding protein H-NS
MDIDLKSMSLDELWALHETICSVLARKLEAEKLSLERRLNELSRIGKASNETPIRRPYPKIHTKFRNPEPPHETWSGRAAGDRAGSARCSKPAKSWTIFEFGKEIERVFSAVFGAARNEFAAVLVLVSTPHTAAEARYGPRHCRGNGGYIHRGVCAGIRIARVDFCCASRVDTASGSRINPQRRHSG